MRFSDISSSGGWVLESKCDPPFERAQACCPLTTSTLTGVHPDSGIMVVVVQSLSRARLFCDSSSSKAKTNFIQTFKSVIRQGARHWLQKKMNEVKVKD